MMKPSRKMILAVAPLFALGFLLLAGCEHHHDHYGNGYHGGRGHGGGKFGKGGKGICYERVLDIDKESGKATYRERVVPCKKGKKKNK